MGASTIVGSAAFNLLVISAVSVVAVNNSNAQNIIESTGLPDPEMPPVGVKKINDMGVFTITAIASVFAYVWLYIVLAVSSPGVVKLWEAIVTLLFFFVLIILAFIADKHNEKKQIMKENNVPPYKLPEILRILQVTEADIKAMSEK